jgi:hypothetical protein
MTKPGPTAAYLRKLPPLVLRAWLASLAKAKGLGGEALRVAVHLASRYGDTRKGPFMKSETFADQLGMHAGNARRAFSALVKAGVLARAKHTTRNGEERRLYLFVVHLDEAAAAQANKYHAIHTGPVEASASPATRKSASRATRAGASGRRGEVRPPPHPRRRDPAR